MFRSPLPILSPESMRLARWQPRHRTPRLRGYVPAQGFNPTQTLCVDLSRCFRLALLSGHRHAYLRIIALSRISAIRLLADASSRASPQQHRLCLLIRSVPLFRLSAGQPLQVSDCASCLCSACAIVASVDTLRTQPISNIVLGKSYGRADFEMRNF